MLPALTLALALSTSAQEELPHARHGHQEKGRVEWFSGTWQEALSKAKSTGKLLFVDFWQVGCAYCKKLDATTFSDASVSKELRGMISLSVNIGSATNMPFVKLHQPTLVPTLLFLEPDGTERDRLLGYLDAQRFSKEVRRIKRNEGTLSALRARIEVDPTDTDARYRYALKLRDRLDERGYAEQLELIAKYDPEGKSRASRRIALERIRKRAEATLETAPLYAFLEKEDDPEILYEGWYYVWSLEGHLEKSTHKSGRRAEHRERKLAAARKLWPLLTPESEDYVLIGNNIAFGFFEDRAHLSAQDLTWALDIAQRVAELAPGDAKIVDTLACCYYAVGKLERALNTIDRCIELEPENLTWRERRAYFERRL